MPGVGLGLIRGVEPIQLIENTVCTLGCFFGVAVFPAHYPAHTLGNSKGLQLIRLEALKVPFLVPALWKGGSALPYCRGPVAAAEGLSGADNASPERIALNQIVSQLIFRSVLYDTIAVECQQNISSRF